MLTAWNLLQSGNNLNDQVDLIRELQTKDRQMAVYRTNITNVTTKHNSAIANWATDKAVFRVKEDNWNTERTRLKGQRWQYAAYGLAAAEIIRQIIQAAIRK